MLKVLVKSLGLLILGGLSTLLLVVALFLNAKPDLEPWHTVILNEEFDQGSNLQTFEEYLALENRLFQELDRRVVASIHDGDVRVVNRFYKGSPSDPGRWSRNWNRSFEFQTERPAAGVLLLHGMSDSPYSLKSQSESLHDAGAWVIGLRLPGHGTVPAALTETRWQDMSAAVALAARDLKGKIGDRPLFIVGYSNGGSLAVHYALTSLSDESRPVPNRLVLISPAIGVTPFAAVAKWQRRAGQWFGLDKFEWDSVSVEYNPFKYSSFAINAGEQTRALTVENTSLLRSMTGSEALAAFPSVLAFQSAVDATVSTAAVMTGLMQLLPANCSELVLFDVNRQAAVEYLLSKDPLQALDPAIHLDQRQYALSIVTNQHDETSATVLRHYAAGAERSVTLPLEARWPDDTFSLSHVALPFPPNDELYGGIVDGSRSHIQVGRAALRGERGVLAISFNEMLRLKWNPFHDWQQRHMLAFLGLGESRHIRSDASTSANSATSSAPRECGDGS